MFRKIQPPEIISALSMSYQLLNLLDLKSLTRITDKPWKNTDKENVRVIQTKATAEFHRVLNGFKRNYELTYVRNYLDTLIKDKNLKVLSSEKRSAKLDLSVDESILLFMFMGQVSSSSSYVTHGEFQQQQFQFHELLSAAINYLLIKDGINNGMGNKHLAEITSQLVDKKHPDFFRQGYLGDLFVSDRIALKARNNIKYLSCNSRWLSTDCFEAMPNKDEGFDVYKLFS